MKKKVWFFLILIPMLLLLCSQIRIKFAEEKLQFPSQEESTLTIYRSPLAKYGNEVEIQSPYGFHRKKFKGKNALNIWKVCQGDLEGDGEAEVALGVYKKAPHHRVLARRPFFYNIRKGELKPKFRASRLSLPMEDFTLYDIDGDGREEVLALEKKGDRYFLAAYHYRSFYLSRDYWTQPLEEKPSFDPREPGAIFYRGKTRLPKINGKEIVIP